MIDDNRLIRVFELSYECLRRKINGGKIRVENEASLQLQFAAILKSVGELFDVEKGEFFSVELEKPISLTGRSFGKSGTAKAKIDIHFAFTNAATTQFFSDPLGIDSRCAHAASDNPLSSCRRTACSLNSGV